MVYKALQRHYKKNEKNSKKLSKVLDKKSNLWYNKGVKRKREVNQND